MKAKITLISILLTIASIAFGQDKTEVQKGNYYFKNISSDVTNKLNSNSKYFHELNDKIKELLEGTSYNISVIKVENDSVYFVFGLFNKADKESLINYQHLSPQEADDFQKSSSTNNRIKSTKNIQYSLPKNTFTDNVETLYNRAEYRMGIYTIPFKLRLSSFSFDANVNLGANLGAKIRWNRRLENGFSFEPIFGFALASIKLDQDNSVATEPTNVSAFTINTGLLIHLTNDINFGLTYGFDNISQNDQNNYNWKYNGKGWLGIGLNISFNDQNKNTQASSPN